jgi:hypothetical protein
MKEIKMNSIRQAAIAAICLFTVAACGKEDAENASSSNLGSGSGSGNALLSYVPNASPYLAANLEPTPDDVIDSYLAKASPVLLTLQSQLVKSRLALENDPESVDAHGILALALLSELDGKLNRPGLESLGFDLQSYKVIYGMGAFPVVRMGLTDAQALNETVQRVLDNADIEAPQLEFEGISYWRVTADTDANDDSEFPAGLYIAILDDHFALSLFPTGVEPELLPAFLGISMPDSSDAEDRLKGINKKYAYAPYFSGLLDFQMLADEFLNTDSLLSQALGQEGEDLPANLSAECKTEIRGIISHTPRVVGGTKELVADALAVQYVVETEAGLAQQLIDLVSDVPLVNAQSNRLLDFSLGMKFGAVRDFLRQKSESIIQAPYTCEHLQDLNNSAAEALEQLNQPLPPLVNNFKGLRLSLSKMGMAQPMPQEIEGLLAVHVDQPEMFVGMAQMFLPDLSGMTLVKGDPPVQLPASLIPIPNVVAFAAMSDKAIGISVGAGEEEHLPAFLARDSIDDGTFMSLNYDTVAYLEMTQKMGENRESEDTHANESREEITKAIQEAYKAMAGRSEVYLRFTENGLVIDSRMTFK